MEASLERVPDGIEPLVGYRAWRYALDRQGVSIYSLAGPGAFGSSAWDMAVFGWATSACRVDRRRRLRPVGECECGGAASDCPVCDRPHLAPQEGCSCGFYAMKDVRFLAGFGGPDVVVGRVELAGKVIEHDIGYRAQHARIAELIPNPGTERSALHVPNRLGIAIGSPARPDIDV